MAGRPGTPLRATADRMTDQPHAPAQAHDEAPTAPAGWQVRLRQILWLLVLCFCLTLGLNLAIGFYPVAALEALLIGILLFALRQVAQQPRLAANLTAVALFAVLTLVMVLNQGLYDEALLTFPALLLFTQTFSSRRALPWMLAAMLLTVVGFFVLDRTGILPSLPRQPLPWRRLFVIALVLAATGLFVRLISQDIQRTMRQLEEGKQALEQSHAQIEILAQRDSLTGLPNRALAKDRLSQLLQQARRNRDMVAVMFLDLDNFKTINDSLGHAAGDALLCQVADTLQGCVRDSDTVARLSGDEFLILMGGLQEEDAIVSVVAKLTHLLSQAFSVEGVDVLVTASLGIAVAPRDGMDVGTLLRHADMAMYQAKDAGRNTFRFFDPSMNESVAEHLHLAAALRSALGTPQLELHYQPQIELASGRIIGAEALVRWRHPELGPISPAHFIPVAERSGLIHDLGAWVLHQACRDAQHWRTQGFADLSVAVNVSALQFRRDDFEREITQALATSGLPASALEVELTESLLMADAAYITNTLQNLASRGVRIAIDDFGTGYSNLGYLRRFAVHRLKIDQSFVRRMTSDPQDEGLVRAIIEMGRCLNLQLVAEGVEDAPTLTRLRQFGCDAGQGFHWSPALPAPAFLDYLRTHTPSVA